jgi:hypothetical protein
MKKIKTKIPPRLSLAGLYNIIIPVRENIGERVE